MSEKIEEWFDLLGTEWWGGIAVYLGATITFYSAIWALIEPLNIPENIWLMNVEYDRRIIHIVLTILFSSHFTLALNFVHRWRQHISRATDEIGAGSIYGINKQDQYRSQIVPRKSDLVYERVLMKDDKLEQELFACRVLLAINAGNIVEEFANELLRESEYQICSMGNCYSLALKQ